MEKQDVSKLVVAYWCHSISASDDKRFFWSVQEVDEITSTTGKDAIKLLMLLGSTVPSQQSGSYFAAGPLENYINQVLKQKLADEAAFFEKSTIFESLLSLAWIDHEQLQLLSQKGKAINVESAFDMKANLSVLSLYDIVLFWFNVRLQSVSDAYEKSYETTLNALMSSKTRDNVIADLRTSAPDNQAIRYLEENIFILHR